MMSYKFIMALMVTVFLFGCSKKITPVIQSDTEMRTEVEIRYVPKDSLIIVPGDTVRLTEIIPCPDVNFAKKVKSSSGKTELDVTIKNGRLTASCNTDSLQAHIHWLEAQSKEVTTTKITNTITKPPKRHIPKWVFWLLAINVVYVLARLAIWKYKIPVKL